MQTSTKRIFLFAGVTTLTIIVAALLVNIFERQQEARLSYLKIVDIPEGTVDPSVWKQNFPREHDAYIQTMRTSEMVEYSKYGRYGGSENFSHLDKAPDLTRLFAGYPFSVEYNEERGHMHSLSDMLSTQRLGDKKPAACLHCHAGGVFQIIDSFGPQEYYNRLAKDVVTTNRLSHPVVCIDCHNPQTMDLRVTRPGFKEAMARRGIDLSNATRQDMRLYVCAQCHVEYYFKGPGKYLTYPWDNGLSVDSIEAYYDREQFSDWTHAETKSPMLKAQHPEYETYSTGIHARSGVTCADCHMPYKREGAVKITDHWIRTPLENITNACLTCHRQSEEEMKGRVLQIQDRTFELLSRAEKATISAMDAMIEAMKEGGDDESLKSARQLHRRAQFRWDFVSAENSMGFHSGGETARILGDAIDYARQAEIEVYRARKQSAAKSKASSGSPAGR